MNLNSKDRAAHWQALVVDALIAAAEANDEKTRTKLISIAKTYEALAVQAESAKNDRPH